MPAGAACSANHTRPMALLWLTGPLSRTIAKNLRVKTLSTPTEQTGTNVGPRPQGHDPRKRLLKRLWFALLALTPSRGCGILAAARRIGAVPYGVANRKHPGGQTL